MEERYKRDKAVESARKMLSLLNVSDADLDKFDALCKDFDLTVGDVTGWDESDLMYNPQNE